MGLAYAVEVAEHNDAYEGDTLVVLDGLRHDRYYGAYGVRVEVSPAASAVGGWCGLTRDGVGNAFSCWHPAHDKVEAAEASLSGYLEIVNAKVTKVRV